MKKIFITEIVKYALVIGISVIALVWASLSRYTLSTLENTLENFLQSSVNIIAYDNKQQDKFIKEHQKNMLSNAETISVILQQDIGLLHNQPMLDSLKKSMLLDEIIITDDNSQIVAISTLSGSSKEICVHISEFLTNNYQNNYVKNKLPVFCERHKQVMQYTGISRKDNQGVIIVGKRYEQLLGSFQSTIVKHISSLYPIYKNGFILVIDKDSQTVLSYNNKKYIGTDVSQLGININLLRNAAKVVTVNVEGKKAFALLRDNGDYSLIALAYTHDVYFGIYVYIAIILASIILLIIFMQLFIIQVINKHVISGISYIIDYLNSITKDNMNHKLDLDTCKEFSILSDSINDMVRRLHNLLISEKNLVIEKESLANAKGDFLARMSHEIRTPLNVIIGIAQMGMRSDYDEAKRKDAFYNINMASTHLLSLLNDILDMSKIDAGKLEISTSQFSLMENMRHINMLVSTKAKEQELFYKPNIEVIDEDIIIGDKLRLNQVLLNLLSNAMKFTPKDKSVSLTMEKLSLTDEDITIRFTVTDEGIGMSKEKLEKIFYPFEQADTSISRSYGGTGLGLSISHNIIALMDSKINVESREGEGSKFWFDITFKRGSVEDEVEDNISFDNNSLSQYRFLMVDDVLLNRKIVTSFLEKTGIKIDEAENGAEAITMYLDAPNGYYNFILMDIHMPNMNGYEATSVIRHSDKMDALTIPIIAVTADAFNETKQQVMDSGMSDFIAKPIQFNKLQKAISKALNSHLNTSENVMIWTKINNLE